MWTILQLGNQIMNPAVLSIDPNQVFHQVKPGEKADTQKNQGKNQVKKLFRRIHWIPCKNQVKNQVKKLFRSISPGEKPGENPGEKPVSPGIIENQVKTRWKTCFVAHGEQ